MYERALFLADSVVQLVLSENEAGRADAKVELRTVVSKVSSCPCLPQLRAGYICEDVPTVYARRCQMPTDMLDI